MITFLVLLVVCWLFGFVAGFLLRPAVAEWLETDEYDPYA